jgi:choline dehydrogenase
VEHGRATGVVLTGGEELSADAIVLCAGAIGSPAILLRSGIADGVGEGLRNHPGVPILLRRTGPPADLHATPITMSWRHGAVDVLALEHLGPEEPGWAMLLTVAMTTSSTGRVRLDPEDPDGPPIVEWELDVSDRARLARSALRTSGAIEHPAFAGVIDEVVVGDGPAGVFHWASTCAIGPALDEAGGVRGHERLFVADASAFPDLPVEHLMLPTIAQAARLAIRFRRRVC